jgi:membrane protein DedA with SNARE-associated domain
VNISNLIASYGYWVLFALVAAESLGVPLPGETALIIAGTYAGHTHKLSPWAIWAVASAAAIVGDNIGYWIGDQGGYRLARRYGPRVRLDERKLKTARYLFDRRGVLVVFFGRFVSVLRAYAAFLAGISKMRWRMFLPANAAGGIVWAGIYTLAAYLAGNALQRASSTINWILGGVAVVAFVVVVLVVRRQFDRLADRAEAAYPGPLDQPAQPSTQAQPDQPDHQDQPDRQTEPDQQTEPDEQAGAQTRDPGTAAGQDASRHGGDVPTATGRGRDPDEAGLAPGQPARPGLLPGRPADRDGRQPPNVTSMVRSSVPRTTLS